MATIHLSDIPAHGIETNHRMRLHCLAPGRVYPMHRLLDTRVRSYRTFSPLPSPGRRGRLFSVALSVGIAPPLIA